MVTRDLVIEQLKQVEDPDLFLDIWFLGLIYKIDIDGSKVNVDMTFTSPMCPAGPQLVGDVKHKVGEIEEVNEVNVEIVFDPPWEPNEEVKAMMGLL